ncbi:MAG: carboxypeptidase-like regulatory domain-containing protein [Cyclobacteriaceae bacterium]|nr:carboxypeptidase-like regulatory domain-containing protein [Cyclobacteriaceae bacterium]
MTRIIFLFFLLSLYPDAIFSQELVDFRLVNSVSKDPVSFASISIVGSNKGTVSNETGQVKLFCDKTHHLIKISAIGFHTREFSLSDLVEKDTVYLDFSTRLLEEVVIFDVQDSAYHLLLKAFDRMRKGLNQNSHRGKAFFRNCCMQDSAYKRMLEVVLEYYEPGDYILQNRQVSIDQMRRTNDYRSLNWNKSVDDINYNKNDFYELFRQDPFMNYISSVSNIEVNTLDIYNKDHYNYYFESIEAYGEDEVIKIRASLDQFKNLPTDVVFYIRRNDHFIPKIEVKVDVDRIVRLNMKRKGLFQMDEFDLRMQSGLSKFTDDQKTLTEYIFNYSENDENIYLEAVRYRDGGCSGVIENQTKDAEGNEIINAYKQYSELVVYEVVFDSPTPIPSRQQVHINNNLYQKSYRYNKRFWNKFEVLPLADIDPKVRKDLEVEQSLEEQFKDQRKGKYEY